VGLGTIQVPRGKWCSVIGSGSAGWPMQDLKMTQEMTICTPKVASHLVSALTPSPFVNNSFILVPSVLLKVHIANNKSQELECRFPIFAAP
jgi:hypothetical protein